jgi:hypothetical protein
MKETPGKLTPSLIGGLTIGVLSSIPIINMGNCLCCMWIIGGGLFGTYLYWRELPSSHVFTAGEGAIIGLLSGLFGALFGTLLNYFFMAFLGLNTGQEILRSIIESGNDLPSEFEEVLDEFDSAGKIAPLFVVFGLSFSLIVNSIFATIGGIIGSAIFKNKKTVKKTTSKTTKKAKK